MLGRWSLLLSRGVQQNEWNDQGFEDVCMHFMDLELTERFHELWYKITTGSAKAFFFHLVARFGERDRNIFEKNNFSIATLFCSLPSPNIGPFAFLSHFCSGRASKTWPVNNDILASQMDHSAGRAGRISSATEDNAQKGRAARRGLESLISNSVCVNQGSLSLSFPS